VSRGIKFRAWDKEEKTMIDADSWYFSDEFEPFIDSVKRSAERFELMQFTGLHDKNGKEIYEGDIIAGSINGHPYKDRVIFKNGCFSMFYSRYDNLYEIADMVEILGNIHENPELLKQ